MSDEAGGDRIAQEVRAAIAAAPMNRIGAVMGVMAAHSPGSAIKHAPRDSTTVFSVFERDNPRQGAELFGKDMTTEVRAIMARTHATRPADAEAVEALFAWLRMPAQTSAHTHARSVPAPPTRQRLTGVA